LIVAGVMSGTSADGIDVALVDIRGQRLKLDFELLWHQHLPYPRPVRDAILRAMNAAQISVAELSRLNFLLGELYAEAVARAMKASRRRVELVGCHGQTLFHQGEKLKYLGRNLACTWQTGEGAVIAATLGIPVVSDFRPADMAAGGKGAPLVPFLDYVLFRDRRTGRIVQNIGGIANLSAIPAGARPEDVMAFDTGPGNMVIDQLMQTLFHKPYDRNGAVAARGRIVDAVLHEMLRNPFFKQKPPRTAGREQFGREYANKLLRRCQGARHEDVIATATALTAQSIAQAIQKFVTPEENYGEYLVSGGGTENRTLMNLLAAELQQLGLKLRKTDEFGLPSQAKEAVAFAVLAYQTWHRQPGNIPSATGAKRAAVLGKISYA
jgi:anhydro-N-acetylmuramic acid kinase